MNLRRQILLVLLIFLCLMILVPKRASAANTPNQRQNYYVDGVAMGKVGVSTLYTYIGPAGDRSPAFTSGIIAKGINPAPNGCRFIHNLKIEVSGTDPLGRTISGDKFVPLSVVITPEQCTQKQEILDLIADVILTNLAPYGLEDLIKYGQSHAGASTNYNTQKAWAEWNYGGFLVSPLDHLQHGMTFGFRLNVDQIDSTLEGTYTLNIHYYAEIWVGRQMYTGFEHSFNLYDTLYYTYINTPSQPEQPHTPAAPPYYTYTSYSFTSKATDPNFDQVRYEFDWNDGNKDTSGWVTPGVDVTMSHSWTSPNLYGVKVRAQDNTGAWSQQSNALWLNVYDRTPPSITVTHPTIGDTTLKHVGSPEGNDCNMQVSINGQGPGVQVSPYGAVSIRYWGNIWARPGSPGNVMLAVIGIENTPLDTTSAMGPGVYPGQSYDRTYTYNIPYSSGTYTLYGIAAAVFTPDQAKQQYIDYPIMRFKVGMIVVGGSSTAVFLHGPTLTVSADIYPQGGSILSAQTINGQQYWASAYLKDSSGNQVLTTLGMTGAGYVGGAFACSYDLSPLPVNAYYYVYVHADSTNGYDSTASACIYYYDSAPWVPSAPSGSMSGSIYTYNLSTRTGDPEGDNIYYQFDWGDGSAWTTYGPYTSGTTITVSHTWSSMTTYTVRVRAKDTLGLWSDWATTQITIHYPRLSISISGSGTTNPAPGTYTYSYGASVTVTATPSSGYYFSYWSLDGQTKTGSSITVTMTADHSLKAYFYYSGGGGGGCVLGNTRILVSDGKTRAASEIKPGDTILGYDVDSGTFVQETVTSNNCTVVDEILSINKGLLFVTPTDQPIYTDQGWIRNPQDLRIGMQIYNPVKHEWTTIYSITTMKGHFRVYDLRATGPDTFIGNGILLDSKTPI